MTPSLWLVLASGPNRDGWREFAQATGAKVFCVNGSLGLCPQPDAYACTDKRILLEYEKHRAALKCPQILGFPAMRALNDGSEYIAGIRPYNVGTWAIYIALKCYGATAVHAFGIYGTDGEQWPTLSIVHGEQTDKEAYRSAVVAAAAAAEPPPPGEVNFKFKRSRERMLSYNENAATIIIAMRRMFTSNIVIHNGGPIAETITRMETTP